MLAHFVKIKQEFLEHLDSINQNTNEIQANYEYLKEFETKLEKLRERIDLDSYGTKRDSDKNRPKFR